MTDTLERREAIARIIDPASWEYHDWIIENDRGEPYRARTDVSLAKADAILALTTSPRIEPIAVATTWSGSPTIGDPAMPKVDSAFSISRRRHEDRFTTSPRVDEGRAIQWLRDKAAGYRAEAKRQGKRVGPLAGAFDEAAAIMEREFATTPADPRVGKMEAERRLLDLGLLREAIDRELGKARSRAATDFATPQHQGQRGQDWDKGFIAAWNIVEAECKAARSTLSQIEGSGM